MNASDVELPMQELLKKYQNRQQSLQQKVHAKL